MYESSKNDGWVECQLPNTEKRRIISLRKCKKAKGEFPYGQVNGSNNNRTCQFVEQGDEFVESRNSSIRTRNKFILMRGILHNIIIQYSSYKKAGYEKTAHLALEEVSKIASLVWRKNSGKFQKYYEMLADFEENSDLLGRLSKQKRFRKQLVLKKLTEAIGRECIPSTYSYETLTNGADTTEPEPMESKNTYKAFCGRFRVRKKKPIQTVAVRWAKIEDVFLI